MENRQPQLKSQPLGIKQKSILATCNYVARRRGVKKLMLVSEATKICPDLVLADGEDLSAFRDVSKTLYGILSLYSWNNKVERLGLDEVFMDITDIVDYNVGLLNPNALHQSFFCLSRDDPERGFYYNASSLAGCVHGAPPTGGDPGFSPIYLRALVASHFAQYLRTELEEQGYTSACGISCNKILSKLVGDRNKPRNQTTLLAFSESQLLSFLDEHKIRKLPGVGARVTRLLENHVLSKDLDLKEHTMECTLTAGQARSHPGMSPGLLEKLLGGPGSEKGIGEKIWGFLHGRDDTDVKQASNIPTQISIEDTYGGLNERDEIIRELRLLSASLLRRMYVDLVEDDKAEYGSGEGRRWVARPRTIRLSTRPKAPPSSSGTYSWARTSRSQPLPSFIFSFVSSRDQVVERLASEVLAPLFQKINPAKRGWNIGLINICVAGMAVTGNDRGFGSGRDISVMFKNQEGALRQWTAYDDEVVSSEFNVHESHPSHSDAGPKSNHTHPMAPHAENVTEGSGSDSGTWEEDEDGWHDDMQHCSRCSQSIPVFALSAHQRYHDMEDDP